jgi:hypothetical protein
MAESKGKRIEKPFYIYTLKELSLSNKSVT